MSVNSCVVLSDDCVSCDYCSVKIISFQGVLDRFSQIKPKIIFSVEAVRYNGKVHNHLLKLKSVVDGLPDIKKVVVYPFCTSYEDIDISSIPNGYVFL